MATWSTTSEQDRRSLEEVHGSVPVLHRNPMKRLFAFLGPAYLVSVGYMDPGNWATDLEGGARFGYALIWVLLMSNLMAVLLQTLSARLGLVTGHDLAQGCRAEYPRQVNFVLWLLAEIAIAATDLAEVLGTIIALKLLFGLPLLWGCLITAFDTFALLYLQKLGMRKMEAVILVLVATIGLCFLIQIVWAGPELGALAAGFVPSLPKDASGSRLTALFIAIGILGATVMPHNLYLHSALVQTRRVGHDRESRRQACWYNFIDSALALNAAFFVNAAILVLAAATFHAHGGVLESIGIEEAHELLPKFLGPAAPILFGVALLAAGQSSTLTGTLAGQIVMEGYLHIRLAPWLRRLVTRMLALVPAVITIALAGDASTQPLLVLSQVILSLQLPFAVVPLIHFTSNRENMGEFTSPRWLRACAWLSASIIVALNVWLVVGAARDWTSEIAALHRYIGPLPLEWAVGGALYGLILAAFGLLSFVVLKPRFWPSPPWKRVEEPMRLDWADTLRPPRMSRIGVALERSPNDSEILARALGIAEPGRTTIVLLHVSDTPMTGVYGPETADRHTQADASYLSDVERVLRDQGYATESVLLFGPDRAARLIAHLKREPVELLVVGSHGHGWVRDLLFGETVGAVRHGVNVPMLIARPGVDRERTEHGSPNTAPS